MQLSQNEYKIQGFQDYFLLLFLSCWNLHTGGWCWRPQANALLSSSLAPAWRKEEDSPLPSTDYEEQLIMRLNWSGWYSAFFQTARGNPVHNSAFVNNPGLRTDPHSAPGKDVTIKWTLYYLHHCLKEEVIGARLTTLGPHTHTSIQTFWCWSLHIRLLVSLGQPWGVQKERERDSTQRLRKYKRVSQKPMLYKHYIMSIKGTVEHRKKRKGKAATRRRDSQNPSCEWSAPLCVCFSWGCERGRVESRLTYPSAPTDKHTSEDDIKRRWTEDMICIYLLWCYTECDTCRINPIYFMRQLVRRDESQALYVYCRRGR